VLGLFNNGDAGMLDLAIEGTCEEALPRELRREFTSAFKNQRKLLSMEHVERISLGRTTEAGDFAFRYARMVGLAAKPVFQNLFRHPDRYVRWDAFERFVKIAEPGDCLDAARRLVDDPYDPIRELVRTEIAQGGKKPENEGK
jgi:hypothetical protein